MRHSALASLIVIITALSSCRHRGQGLPFYIAPDLTPLWMDPKSDSFRHIHQIPPFRFLNQNGEVVTEQAVENKIYVANFVFTTCAGICPKMIGNFCILQKAYAADPDIVLLSHTVNPEVDSVGRLRVFAIKKNIHAPQWQLLTGSKTDLYMLAKKSYFAGDSLGYYGDLNTFLHTEKVFLIDKHRRIRGVYNGTLQLEMDRILDDIKVLKQEE